MQLMLQATVCDCLALDPFAFEEDGLSAPEVARHGFVGIAGREQDFEVGLCGKRLSFDDLG